MDNLREKLKKINIEAKIDFNEPMSNHTSFKTGGPAEFYAEPKNIFDLQQLLLLARETDTSYFIFGGGANLLVADKGISGLVINTKNLNRSKLLGENLIDLEAGISIDTAASLALKAELIGFDSFFGMPGTIGGAVWMNARCYGKSISDIVISASYLDTDFTKKTITKKEMLFDYKKSIFQTKNWIITNAVFSLSPGSKDQILKSMITNKEDRKIKGHYDMPSAGSVFKNNRQFGKPSGSIIDSLNLRGSKIGGAMVSEQHANIIFNTGDASSKDIKRLISFVQSKVLKELGLFLEPEIQFIGNWD